VRLSIAGSIIVLVIASACASEGAKGPAAPDQVTGVVIDIVASEIDDIQSFTLKDGDAQYDIYIADDVEYGFPLGHLHEHLQTADPVTVDLEERDDDRLYALTIEDV
jgi:hypothetical protein